MSFSFFRRCLPQEEKDKIGHNYEKNQRKQQCWSGKQLTNYFFNIILYSAAISMRLTSAQQPKGRTQNESDKMSSRTQSERATNCQVLLRKVRQSNKVEKRARKAAAKATAKARREEAKDAKSTSSDASITSAGIPPKVQFIDQSAIMRLMTKLDNTNVVKFREMLENEKVTQVLIYQQLVQRSFSSRQQSRTQS